MTWYLALFVRSSPRPHRLDVDLDRRRRAETAAGQILELDAFRLAEFSSIVFV